MIPLLRKPNCSVADTDCFQSVVSKSGAERSPEVKTGGANQLGVATETARVKRKAAS